ncbi:MAG: deoxyribonuclease IV [Desulfobacterales bacterium]|jgi:deoxyribonuclease-4|nr:deoxyribonuclease IV [Desulfobacterales bacterium]
MKKTTGRRRAVTKAGRGAAEEKLILLGAHFSIAGGLTRALEEAAAYGCPVLQMFTKNASTWKEREVSEADAQAFRRRRQALGIRFVAAHTAYLINLAAAKEELRRRSREALRCEMARSALLGLDAVVLHPGSHTGDGVETGIARIQEEIDAVMAAVPDTGCRLLLETTAGQGTGIGHRFEELAAIRDGLASRRRVGFCLDTAHIFAAGYDLRDAASLRQTLADFDATCGLAHLVLIHLNDSLKPLGSRVDRHASIGAGYIGIGGFGAIMREERLAKIAKILETPKRNEAGRDMDRVNLDLLRSLARPPLSGRVADRKD